MRLLILANMGPIKEDPAKNRYVYDQYHQLKSSRSFEFIEYFYLQPFVRLAKLNLFKYPWFFACFFWRYMLSFKKLDIIHVHYFFPTIIAAVAYKLLRRPSVKILVTFHGSDIYAYQPPNRLYRWCFGFVDEAIFVSNSLRERFSLPLPKQTHVLSAGMLDLFAPVAQPDDQKPQDLLFVGHLDRNKGIHRLLMLLNNGQSDLSITIVGSGFTGSDFNEAIKGSTHRVTYVPSATPEQLQTLYSNSRFLLNLSYAESFGLVLSEAMACGTPVIATVTDGSNEQVKAGFNGFVLDNKDDWLNANLYGELRQKLAMDKADYQQLSDHAMASAGKHKLSAVCDNLYQIYSRLLGNDE